MKLTIIETDVLVVGGGSAGIAAAVGAAKQGVDVVMIEKNSFPGGKATAAMVGTVCGIYLRENCPEFRFSMNGFPRQFCERLQHESQSAPVTGSDGLKFLPYKPEAFKALSEGILKECKVRTIYNCGLTDCEIEKTQFTALTVTSGAEQLLIQPRTIIDTTGAAVVSVMAGLPVIESEKYQAPAQVFSMQGVNENDAFLLGLVLRRSIIKAAQSGKLNPVLANTSIIPGSLQHNEIMLKIGFLQQTTDKPGEQERLNRKGIEYAQELSEFLIATVPCFKTSKLKTIATEVGVRTTKRSLGKFVLEEDHVLHCAKFETVIANGAWPIEFWGENGKLEMTFFEESGYYQIPAACLISNHASNLFFAGRNISASEKAIASARVMGTCLGTGYAAGVLAATQVKDEEENDAIELVREEQVYL